MERTGIAIQSRGRIWGFLIKKSQHYRITLADITGISGINLNF